MSDPSDIAIVRQCIDLVTEGPTFEEWEFETLFGRTRDEVRATGASLGVAGSKTHDTVVVVGDVLNNLAGYPGAERDWAKWVSVPRGVALSVLEGWLDANSIAG